MMIWQYLIPTANSGVREAYGCPVDVSVAGRQLRAVYQFQGGDGGQKCAVVHLASGRIMAYCKDRHTGYPQQRAQAAVDEAMKNRQPSAVWSVIDAAEVLNTLPSVVGVLR